MSKKGGGRAATTGVRAIANVLGIARHEISSYTQMKKESVELFPQLSRQPLTLESTNEIKYMAVFKQELLHRFHESSFYHSKSGKRDVRRYTDKYRTLNKETFEPHWERLPAELNWKKSAKERAAKRRKLDDELVEKKLASLAEKDEEKLNVNDDSEKDESDKDEEDKNNDDDAEPLSDDDYMEEDNDYIQNYFDNGDAYAEGSDDNLGEDY